MSFKFIDHFLVRPNSHLRQKAAEFKAKSGSNFASALTDLIMWSRVREQHEHPRAALVKMKFYFLMDLHDEYLRDSRSSLSPFLKELLGEPPYTEQIFDLWWRVEHVTDGGRIEATEVTFRERNLGALVVSNHPVLEAWLKRFRKDD